MSRLVGLKERYRAELHNHRNNVNGGQLNIIVKLTIISWATMTKQVFTVFAGVGCEYSTI